MWNEDMLQFACIVTDPDDDSIYPIILETVYPPDTKPEDLPELPPVDAGDRSGLPSAFRKPLKWPAFDSKYNMQGEET